MRARVVACFVAVLALVGTAAPAWAAPSTEVIQGQVLRLVSVADWDAASSLSTGTPVRWDVTVSAHAPDPGTVTLGLSADGDAALRVDVALCRDAWQQDVCPGGARTLRAGWEIPLDGAEVALTQMADTDVAYVRMSVALEPGVHEGSTSIRFHATGESESAVVGTGGGLAITGMSPVVPWILGGGAVLVVLGLLLAFVRGRRRPADADEDEEPEVEP
ncbi:MAG: hypothetical protein J7484_11880 [Microbacterium sp.]|nr:hypothetical protein [Microbacterium sp.]